MRVRIPIKDLKLWWPAWQMAVPINAYGFSAPGHIGKIRASGEDYDFYVDPELDSFWVKEGEFLPLSGAALICLFNPAAPERVQYTSYCICTNGRVQVNYTDDNGSSFNVRHYALEDLYIEGESYSEDD